MIDTPRPSRSPRARRLARIWRIVRVPAIAYLVLLLLAMLFENKLIFFPSRYPEGDWHPAGMQPEDAWFSADGLRLHGWYLDHDNPRAVVLFCHGNAGNVTNRATTLQLLNRRVGAKVLLLDYRGYGRSEGSPSESGILADARAARAWLARRTGVAESEIVLIGRSIGGAVAVDLAAGDGARALVLESTFNTLPDAAAYHFPWFPVRWVMRTRLESQGKIADYHGPLLQSHGTADTVVPYELGRRLFEAANEPKQFITLPGHDHNDPLPPDYYDTLVAFLDAPPAPADQRR